MEKSPDAFRTISEVAEWLDTPTYVLRFWESRFPQIKPVKRAGGRRYYRREDMLLLGGIKKLLHFDGHTIKAVQTLVKEKGPKHIAAMSPGLDEKVVSPENEEKEAPIDLEKLAAIEEKKTRQKRRRQRKPRPEVKAAPETGDTETIETKTNKPEKHETEKAQIAPKVTVTVHKKAKEKQVETPDVTAVPAQKTAQPQSPVPIKLSQNKLMPGPFGIKPARSYSPDDLQQIETLYYSLKMVRNNMKRAHAQQ